MTGEEIEDFVRQNKARIEFLAQRFGIEMDEAVQRARVLWWMFWREARQASSPKAYVMASIRNNLYNEWKRREVYSPIRGSLNDQVVLPDGQRGELWQTISAKEKPPSEVVNDESIGIRVDDESTWLKVERRPERRDPPWRR